ncbi:hypothetical protein LNTAR_25475 [Lentisphaera araneosa HTCC2155]|uniref:Uncharacterized protein n=1 Tax=Lentisphaera araneosa HTCC2155 TaxID=313628 RepID=A6DSD7_9BACT|nr:hypothetical protein [Lentisphaera araneosa]EDM25482.1 hypothetical protein LNTAR_25475 [Lentisphaera araneosa HTCC2155]
MAKILSKAKQILKEKAEKRIEQKQTQELYQTMVQIEREEATAKLEAERKKQHDENEKQIAEQKAYQNEQRSLNMALSQVQQVCSHYDNQSDAQKAYIVARDKFLKAVKSAGIKTPMLDTLTF